MKVRRTDKKVREACLFVTRSFETNSECLFRRKESWISMKNKANSRDKFLSFATFCPFEFLWKIKLQFKSSHWNEGVQRPVKIPYFLSLPSQLANFKKIYYSEPLFRAVKRGQKKMCGQASKRMPSRASYLATLYK